MASGMEVVGNKLEAAKDQIVGDFNKGASDMNFFNTAGDIINEQIGKLKGPLEGFQASTIAAPDLILARKKIDEEIMSSSTVTDSIVDKPAFEANTAWIEAEKEKLSAPVVFTVSGKMEAMEMGSAEAIARIQEYQNAVTVTQGVNGENVSAEGGGGKKTSQKAIEDQKVMNDLLAQIAKNTQKEKGVLTMKSAELSAGGI